MPAARTGKLARAEDPQPIVVDAAFVRAHLGKPGFAVVDGRAAVFYDGVDTGGMHDRPHKTGHIAGADSVPFTESTDDDRHAPSPAELRGAASPRPA